MMYFVRKTLQQFVHTPYSPLACPRDTHGNG